MKIIQQGDILFIPIKEIPKEAKKVESKKYHILAEGEATGHSHRVSVKEVDFYTIKDQKFVKLWGEVARVLHEEHKTKELTNPLYEVKTIQEYDYDTEQARQIRD